MQGRCGKGHTCCGQKIKLGPQYIILCFNGRQKWEIWSICLVSLKDQEETAMGLLHAVWIKKWGKRQWEAIWRPDGGVEGCMSSVITRMQTYCEDPRDVTLPIEKYYYHLHSRNKLSLRDFAVVTGECDSQRAVSVVHTHSCIFLLSSFRWSCPALWV